MRVLATMALSFAAGLFLVLVLPWSGWYLWAAAGICLHKKTGQPVEAGEPLCTLYTNRPETLEAAAAAYTAAITIGAQPPVEQPLIYDTVRCPPADRLHTPGPLSGHFAERGPFSCQIGTTARCFYWKRKNLENNY